MSDGNRYLTHEHLDELRQRKTYLSVVWEFNYRHHIVPNTRIRDQLSDVVDEIAALESYLNG